jgi:beta-1,4-mannosyltransferase
MRACVVVFGDLGRSPRMNYHTRSLLRNGFLVDLVGFAESPLVEELQTSKTLRIHGLAKFPAVPLPRLLLAPFKGFFPLFFISFFDVLLKALWMTITLFFTLLFLDRPKFILVQNPPSIPTLAVAWFVCRLRGSKLVVDWHNFGFSILAMSVRNTLVVAVAKWFERFFGRLADAHFCVSKAMQRELESNWGITKVHVLHDCPPEFFGPATEAQRKDLFSRDPLKSLVGLFDADNTRVAVTATSFTKDEKLDMLLYAIQQFDNIAQSDESIAQSLFVVTGKVRICLFVCFCNF